MYSFSDSLSLAIEFPAPVLLVPEDSSRDLGCLKIDFGHISARGRMPTGDGSTEMGSSHNHGRGEGGDGGGRGRAMDLDSKAGPHCTFISTHVTNMSVALHPSFQQISTRLQTQIHAAEQLGRSQVREEEEDTESRSEDILYIIQPFGVRMDVHMPSALTKRIHVDLADNNVSFVIAPRIEMTLTAVTLSRLLHMLDLLQGAMTPPSAAAGTGAGSATGTATATATLAALMVATSDSVLVPEEEEDKTEGCLRQTDSETEAESKRAQQQRKEEEEEVACNLVMLVQMTLPEIKLVLVYEENMQYNMDISLTEMHFDFQDRLYDSVVTLSLGSLAVLDSKRSESQQYLAHSALTSAKSGQSTEELIHITVTTIKSRKSPLYSQYGIDLDLRLGTLSLNMDAKTVLHLRPFYEVLSLGRSLWHYPAPLPPLHATAALQLHPQHGDAGPESATAAAATAISSIPNIPAGLQLTMSLNSISLEVLKDDGVNTDDTSAGTRLETRASVLESVGRLQMQGLASWVRMEAERTCDVRRCAEVSGSGGERGGATGVTNELSAAVTMKSLVVTDTRSTSEAHVHTTILCPAAASAVTSSATMTQDQRAGQGGGEGEEDGDQVRVEFTSETVSTVHQVRNQQRGEGGGGWQQQEHTETTAHTAIRTNHMDVYVSLDAIMELLNVGLENVAALTALTAPLSLEDEEEEEEDDEDEEEEDDDEAFYDALSRPSSERQSPRSNKYRCAEDSLNDPKYEDMGFLDVEEEEEEELSEGGEGLPALLLREKEREKVAGVLVRTKSTSTFATTSVVMPSPKLYVPHLRPYHSLSLSLCVCVCLCVCLSICVCVCDFLSLSLYRSLSLSLSFFFCFLSLSLHDCVATVCPTRLHGYQTHAFVLQF